MRLQFYFCLSCFFLKTGFTTGTSEAAVLFLPELFFFKRQVSQQALVRLQFYFCSSCFFKRQVLQQALVRLQFYLCMSCFFKTGFTTSTSEAAVLFLPELFLKDKFHNKH